MSEQQYNPGQIEPKWQKFWEQKGLHKAENFSKKPKIFLLVEFPYPSGAGLHVGHCRSYTAMDIIARKKRMQGYNVLFPMGWDAFGLPSENYAIKTGIHPSITTKQSVETFKKQEKSLGLSFDWSREINTTDPAYYKWTQWLFLKLFERGLAYKAKIPINWCLSCKIGLANEEVIDGRCERCGGEIEKREKEQWLIKITNYAQRLIDDLALVDFPERVKSQQKEWIGKSKGYEITFTLNLKSQNSNLKIFTTRIDTIFGCTYLVVAPEHEIIKNQELGIKNYEEVEEYIGKAKKKSELERQAETKEKTGVKIEGIMAINPANGKEIPIFVADYVLTGYGTGAIMAVPAHDQRDFGFAKKYKLPIKEVVIPLISEKRQEDRRRDVVKAVIIKDNEVFIVKEADPSDLKVSLALPGGAYEKDEDDLMCLQRELLEEVGPNEYKIEECLGECENYYYSETKKLNIVRRIKAYRVKIQGDIKIKNVDSSIIETGWMGIKEAIQKIRQGKFKGENVFIERAIDENQLCFTGKGILVNSEQFDELESKVAREEIGRCLAKKGLAEKQVYYKLRDWVFSRQHYWGEPVPIIHCYNCTIKEKNGGETANLPSCPPGGTESGGSGDVSTLRQEYNSIQPKAIPVPEKDLPVKLPDIEKYEPTETGESPLAKITEWVNTKCPVCAGPAKRETDTMPNWAGSNWYFIRYCDPHNDKQFASPDLLKYWMPVDWYNGGMEHTTLHLLYSRFIYKFLWDIGEVPKELGPEPYKKRTSHGMILAEGRVKMSKSKSNVINPDDIVKQYGADTLRLYEMFMGPFEQAISWDVKGVRGVYRFLGKIYKLKLKTKNENLKSTSKNLNLEKLLHKTIKKVSEDIEQMKFNTAVSALMILVNEMEKEAEVPREIFEKFLLILAPFAPHIAEQLFSELKTKNEKLKTKIKNLKLEESIFEEEWPSYDENFIQEEKINLIVQINGKVRGCLKVERGADEQAVLGLVKAEPKIAKWLEGKNIKKTIFIKNKLLNFII